MTDRHYWNKPLTEKELSEILNGDDSELDELDVEDDDYFEDRDVQSRDDNESVAGDISEDPEETAFIEVASESCGIENMSTQEIHTCQTAQAFASEYLKSQNLIEKGDISWIKGSYEISSNIQFYQAKKEEVISLPTPVDIFSQYFTDALLDICVEKTNLYAVRTSVPNFPATNKSEVKTFFGILMVMGNLNYPRVRMYWEPKFAVPLICENMQVNRFFKLRNVMHFTSEEDQKSDHRLWKVRPLFNCIRETCRKLEPEKVYSIDEQMVPFKGAVNIKQYIKNKPTRWGIKLFLLCGISGTIYDFIVYQGANTELKTEYMLFGQCPAVVILNFSG